MLSVIAIVVVYTAAVVGLMHRNLVAQVDRLLALDIQAGISAMGSVPEPTDATLTRGAPHPQGSAVVGDSLQEAWRVNPDGAYRLLAGDPNAGNLPALEHGIRNALRSIFGTGSGQSLYTVIATRSSEGHLYQIQVARPSGLVTRPLSELALWLLASVFGVLVFAWIAGVSIAGRAMSPINQVIRRTRAMRLMDLNERLPESGPKDELRELSRVINQMLSRVQESYQRERNFADDVAHELRTPLTAQIMQAEIMLSQRRGANSPDPRETVHSMLEEARHMQRLIDGLLTLTRVTTKSEAVVLQAVDAVAVAKDCICTLQVLAEEKEQSLQLRHDGCPFAQAEPTMLRQALMNIVHNAINHCGARACIVVRVRAEPPKAGAACRRNHVLITVDDNGPGIPQEQRDRVFERFVRGPVGRRHQSRGLGLGLAIAKAMTEAQGGRIRVADTSTLQRGTRLELSLRAPPATGVAWRRSFALPNMVELRTTLAMARSDIGSLTSPAAKSS